MVFRVHPSNNAPTALTKQWGLIRNSSFIIANSMLPLASLLEQQDALWQQLQEQIADLNKLETPESDARSEATNADRIHDAIRLLEQDEAAEGSEGDGDADSELL